MDVRVIISFSLCSSGTVEFKVDQVSLGLNAAKREIVLSLREIALKVTD